MSLIANIHPKYIPQLFAFIENQGYAVLENAVTNNRQLDAITVVIARSIISVRALFRIQAAPEKISHSPLTLYLVRQNVLTRFF